MHTTGKLVLYNEWTQEVVWDSLTEGMGVSRVMQSDGNLVIPPLR